MEDLVNTRSFHASYLNLPPTTTYPASLEYQSPTQMTTNLKGQWSDDEDRKLVDLVNKHGPRRWSKVSAEMINRTGKQCRERWQNHLRRDIKKDAWSSDEEILLVRAHMELGNQWSTIAKCIWGRTENSIKNYWNAAKRRILTKQKNNTMSREKMSILEAYITSLPDSEDGYQTTFIDHQNNGPQNHTPNAVVVEPKTAPLYLSPNFGGRATPAMGDQMLNDFEFGYPSGVNYQQNNGDQNNGFNLNVERTNMSSVEANTTPLYPVSDNGCQFTITTTDDQMVNNYLDEVNLPYIDHVDKLSYDVDQFIHPTSVYGRQNNCSDQNYTPNMEPVNTAFVEANAAPLYPSSDDGWCPAATTAYDQTVVMNNHLFGEVNIPLSDSDLLTSNACAPLGRTMEAVDDGCRFAMNTDGQMVNNYLGKEGDVSYLDHVDKFTTAFDQFVYPTSVYQSQNNSSGQNYGPNNYMEPTVSMPVVEANMTPMYPSFDNGGFRAATTANGQMMLNNPLDFDLSTSNIYEPLDQTMAAADDGNWWYGQRCGDEVWNDQTEITY